MEQVNNILGQAFQGLKLQDNANAERVANLLDQFGLRWSVNKEPLFLADGTQTPFVGIVRDDTRQVFSTCKDSYNPYQNSELAELLIRIADIGGYEIHKGGMFKDGSKVYVQLKSGNVIDGIGKNRDKVIGYTTGINSHDGSTSLKWGSTNITISCQNTFNAASKELANSLRHTNNLHNKIDIYLREVGIAVVEEKSLFDKFIKLSEIPVVQKHITKVVREVTGVDILMNEVEAKDKFGTYNLNRTSELLECISLEMAQKGDTMWGLFSGVTNYTTHIMPVPKRENARLESKYVGNGGKIDNRVFDLISTLN
jgi:phage/plasmid-like protein (TIGR03299 family)